MIRAIFFSKILILGLLMGGGAVSISACNTVEGVGEDVSAAGRGVSRGARDVKKKL
jgi:predicted small secreted protein